MSPPVYVLMCFHFMLTVLLIKSASRDQTSVCISPAGFVNFTASNAPLAVFVSAVLDVSTHLHGSGHGEHVFVIQIWSEVRPSGVWI